MNIIIGELKTKQHYYIFEWLWSNLNWFLSLKTIFWANLISKLKNSHLETTLIHTVHTVHSYRVTHVFFSLISTRRFREVSHATVASYKIFSTFGNSSEKTDLNVHTIIVIALSRIWTPIEKLIFKETTFSEKFKLQEKRFWIKVNNIFWVV